MDCDHTENVSTIVAKVQSERLMNFLERIAQTIRTDP